MNKELFSASTFIQVCFLRGVCGRGQVRKYIDANPKEYYTEDDVAALGAGCFDPKAFRGGIWCNRNRLAAYDGTDKTVGKGSSN